MKACFPLLLIAGLCICLASGAQEAIPTQGHYSKDENHDFAMAVRPFVIAQKKTPADLTPKDFAAMRQNMEKFWSAHPASDRSGTLLSSYMWTYGKVHPDLVTKEWATFVDCASPVAAELARRKIRFFELAKEPLEFEFTAMDGKRVDLVSLRGRVVLIVFWATWCRPCIEEFPVLRSVYASYHRRGLEMIGVSLDRAEDRQKVLEMIRRERLVWPQCFDGKGDENLVAKKYAVRATPTIFLLGKDGHLADMDFSAEKLRAKIERLLK